jgi:transcription elongation factor GreA
MGGTEMVVMEPVEEAIVLTDMGRRRLEDELEKLITVDRHEVAARIRDAKDYGELTENAEYEQAKTDQAFVEGRILDIKSVLARARVLDTHEIATDRISLGSRVALKDLEFDEDWTVVIVSAYEADPDADRISDVSPVGRALIGHVVGDIDTVNTPGGATRFEVSAIASL